MKLKLILLSAAIALNAIALTGCGTNGEIPADNDTNQNTTSSTAQTGDSDSEDEQLPSDPEEGIPEEIDGVRVRQVSLGFYHSAALTTDGSLYMWGANYCGQLGNGTTEDSSTPVKIMDNVTDVSLGTPCSAAITTDGNLYMWGSNWKGQLGDGTTEYSLTPVKIMDDVANVSLGYHNSAAIATDGSLYTWGANTFGKLGNGKSRDYDGVKYSEEVDSSTPIKITIPPDA